MPSQVSPANQRNLLQKEAEALLKKVRIVVEQQKAIAMIRTVMKLMMRKLNGLRNIRNKNWPNSIMYYKDLKKFKIN